MDLATIPRLTTALRAKQEIFAPDLGRVRLDREQNDKEREKYASDLANAREKLTWDNFSSVPLEQRAELQKKYKQFIAILQMVKQYDAIDINEMALDVYNAVGDQTKRADAEKVYGKGLEKYWYTFNELCMELKKYYKMKSSSRKDIMTTLDKIYAQDLPLSLDFFANTNFTAKETIETGPATTNCEPESKAPKDDTVYDSDWLLAICDDYLSSHPLSRDVFTPNTLCECILSMLESGGADQNQEDLLNLLGIDSVEFVFQILQHRDDLLHGADDFSMEGMIADASPSARPVDDLGLNDAYLRQLKKQGLTLPMEPIGAQPQYKGYMSGVKLDHSITADQRVLGQKTFKQDYEELYVEPEQKQAAQNIPLVPVSVLEDYGQLLFEGVEKFNRLQSWVFDCAYNSDNNMLVCAPTGAGKTNVALLTILHEIRKNMEEQGVLRREELKIIYVAPMKALAQEIVAKFTNSLKRLGLLVRELTGDMQLTRQEIAETQVIVTTPEKWDVITRKTGDNTLVEKVKLLILDEVHLLASDRGDVVESITARTLRQIESTQKPIRLVGLSATLPNYMDVAEFLRVDDKPGKGLFYCDDSFRPVPLAQRFIGVTLSNRMKAIEKMYELAYDRVVDELKNGKQAMVFVHSRKDTVTTANKIIEYSQNGRTQSLFTVPLDHPRYAYYKGRVDRSRNRILQDLFKVGMGVHHAGMFRADRTLVEDMFRDGVIRVLCCTSTLAWGVNLPAHGVIIKGTELYDAARGGWVDIDILDVIQIFGRAGRPQFDTTGEGCIIGMHDHIDNFARLMVMKNPIESRFMKNLCDHMNAEIIAGTVTNIREAIIWLQYTYMYIRMRKNPLIYGVSNEERMRDPSLYLKCEELIMDTANKLDGAHMIRYDPETSNLFPTDLGRIASHFYISYSTVEIINEKLTDMATLKDILLIISMSQEFQSIKVRDEELTELADMKRQCLVGMDMKFDDEYTKTLVLLQAYIDRWTPKQPTLNSDFIYISQNAGRIARALFEICIQRGWAQAAYLVLNLCKSIEKRIWFNEHPLQQIPMSNELLYRIIKRDLSLDDLRDMDAQEIEAYIDQKKIGSQIKRYVHMIPYYDVEGVLQPVTATIIRVSVKIRCDYYWMMNTHGPTDSLWVWIENSNTHTILYSEEMQIPYKKRNEDQTLEFAIPVTPPFPEYYTLRVNNDHWIGADVVVYLPLRGLRMPNDSKMQTPLLDLTPLPITALKNRQYQSFFNFTHFNAVQTQVFYKTFHTDDNILLCAPTGSGKTVVAELAVMRMLEAHKGEKAVYIGPLKSLVREKLLDWKNKFENRLHRRVIELTGDSAPELGQIRRADIIVTTPEKWDGVSRQWEQREYVQQVGLIIIDEIHLLGSDRGTIIEVLVSRLRFIERSLKKHIRVIGLSTALANANDLADWLNIHGTGLYNFSHSVRPVQLQVHISGYPGKHYCPRMATMNKPAYTAIRQYSPNKPVIVFVSSRRQTRLTAFGIINYAAFDDPFQWLHMNSDEMRVLISTVKDENLRQTLPFGVGIHHAGMCASDRMLVERLFSQEKIQILCTTSTLAWGVNLPAYLVIVKGTEFHDPKTCRWVDYPITDVLQMMGRAGRPQFDSEGVACVMVHDIKKNYYKKFLYEPFPVESSLHNNLHDHINAEIAAGNLKSIQDVIDYLSWTFFYRRLMNNPSYYGLYSDKVEDFQSFLLNMILRILKDLQDSKCVAMKENNTLVSLPLGKISSFYYIQHKTIRMFSEQLFQVEQVPEFLQLVSAASEYDTAPVRHNEDQEIEQFSHNMYWPVEDQTNFGDAHTKVYLLLQSFMMRLPLPVTDFINDQNSVLDNSMRLVNALIDVAGYLNLSFQLKLIMRSMPYLIQAIMPYDSELIQLEGVDNNTMKRLKAEGIMKLKDMRGRSDEELKQVLNKCRLDKRAAENIIKNVRNLPDLALEVEILREGKAIDKNSAVFLSHYEYEVHASVSLKKEVPQRVNAPRFKKPKNYSYFVIVEDGKGAVLGWKRLSVIHHSTVKIPIQFKQEGADVLTVCVLCDSVVGLEVEETIHMTVTNNEAEVKECEVKGEQMNEFVDEMLDDSEFDDDDIVYDEYLND